MGISTKVEISGKRECAVELVGLEPATRLLIDAVRGDQLLTMAHHDRLGSLPKDVNYTAISAPSVSDREIRFPRNREPGFGDAVGMQIRVGVRRFANPR